MSTYTVTSHKLAGHEHGDTVTDADLEADKRAQPITVTNDDDDDDDDADDEYREEPAHDEL